ncbi:MAG: RecBCD enzyme subunit RecC [Nitrospira sp.]|nr:RecBCD enzyme subunit RecC [Nitrospira sp.]
MAHVVGHAAGHVFHTDVVGKKDDCKAIDPLCRDTAKETLALMLKLYETGTKAKLPFAPSCSYEFVENLARGQTEDDALAAADKAWSQGRFPECDDPYLFEVWGEDGPMQDSRFKDNATAFWGRFVQPPSAEPAAAPATEEEDVNE